MWTTCPRLLPDSVAAGARTSDHWVTTVLYLGHQTIKSTMLSLKYWALFKYTYLKHARGSGWPYLISSSTVVCGCTLSSAAMSDWRSPLVAVPFTDSITSPGSIVSLLHSHICCNNNTAHYHSTIVARWRQFASHIMQPSLDWPHSTPKKNNLISSAIFPRHMSHSPYSSSPQKHLPLLCGESWTLI